MAPLLKISVRCCNPDCNQKLAKLGGTAFAVEILCPKCNWLSEFQTAEHGVKAVAIADARGRAVAEPVA